MTTDEDKWISVDKRTKNLVIRFRVKGCQKQFYIASGLKDTKRNREVVRLKRDAIVNDITLNRFDKTLNSYQFKIIYQPKLTLNKNNELNILQIWQKFTEYKQTQIEKTTILNRYAAIERYINKFPTLCLKEAPRIRDWLINQTTKYMSWLIIKSCSECCEWAINSNLITFNPFEKLKTKEPKRTRSKNYKAFTLEQRDLIINEFEKHPINSYHASLIKFLFWTGCRPGEAFALTWGDISSDCCKIKFDKSCNLFRIKKNTKNNLQRVFPTVSQSKLNKLLLAIKPVNPSPSQLVFTTPTGRPVTSATLRIAWAGQKRVSKSGKEYEYKGIVTELAANNKIPYLKPYATRHTFATWAITQGISPDKVALWIGDTIETVLKYYCHPDVVNAVCPDF